MSDSVDRVFVHALNTVKRIPRTGSARPPESDRLKLYGLYKQSMEGDVEGVIQRPQVGGKEEIAETEKWEAWQSHAGLSRTEAKRQYISTLIDTMHRYATTTPEALELVAELEFVWDQIKTNSASSSGSSPEQLARSQATQEASLIGKFGKLIRPAPKNNGDRLRVLRPLSDGDAEADEEGDIGHTRQIDLDSGKDRNANFPPPLSNDFDIRNRKWRKRVEQALVTMTVEIAALREQVEGKRFGNSRRRSGLSAWILRLAWASMRHLLVDTALLAMLIMWARNREDRRVEQGLQLMAFVAKEQIMRLRIPRASRTPAKR